MATEQERKRRKPLKYISNPETDPAFVASRVPSTVGAVDRSTPAPTMADNFRDYIGGIGQKLAGPAMRVAQAQQDWGPLAAPVQIGREIGGAIGEGVSSVKRAAVPYAEAALAAAIPAIAGEKGAAALGIGLAAQPKMPEVSAIPPQAQPELGEVPTRARQTEFTDEDATRFAVPEDESFAGTLSGGGTFQTVPGWSAQDQARLDQLHAEGYGTQGEIARGSKAVARRSGPAKTDTWTRHQEMLNAQRGGPTQWELRHMEPGEAKLALARHQAGIDRVAARHAAEDTQGTLQDVAQTKADAEIATASTGPDYADQIRAARLQFDAGTEVAKRERLDEEVETGRQATILEDVPKVFNLYGLPEGSESFLAEVADKAKLPVQRIGARLAAVLAAHPEWAEDFAAHGEQIRDEVLRGLSQ